MSAVLIRRSKIKIRTGSVDNRKSSLGLQEMPVFRAYVQSTSLKEDPVFAAWGKKRQETTPFSV
jgi:hypothetical protein